MILRFINQKYATFKFKRYRYDFLIAPAESDDK